ncbi:MAG: hypothetical protein COV72_02560 [Candidatus Omnitrophica bacterium CG11_big_fil_rev_8_21_14_0_20_42_13]|uniref:Doubled CXXCH motif domain-containing protein n=1 Tax=Candidatus Ghiorseimicrobium undicola TaxID=1974746 RepID=A0A2H0M1B7_9BACT|nr:MAG: hypothetical protein COV72_02560 [Candidatus Omnitrophica bacterium CG11_big_fil_rev_8_21_14_0_20_42_13]
MKSIKTLLPIFVFIVCLFAASHVFASHGQGQKCYMCHHAMHNNNSHVVIDRKAVDNGQIACYDCHSSASAVAAPDTEKEFISGYSRHPLGSDSECVVCHDLGSSHIDGNLDSWPDITLKDPDSADSHVYTGVKINDFCLSCHDNSPVTLGGAANVPVDLSSAYEFTGHGKISIDEPCNSCHEHHASMTKPYLIKDVINSANVTGNDNSVCFACHSYSEGIYPGKNVYLSSEHGIQNKLCIDCHNPHGDNKDLCYLCHNANYSAHYSTQRDKLCIDCHNPHEKNDLKMNREDEEKLCFICHSGLENEFGNIRDGVGGAFSHHKVDDEEFAGGRVECFDCHNPHVVTKLNIISDPEDPLLMPRPFSSASYRQRTAVYDDFCLSCHDGSRMGAKDIASELSDENYLDSGFTEDGSKNLHAEHKDKNFGCQNCHDAHSSDGTGGMQRGALLHEEITVNDWDPSGGYNNGKNSCDTSALGMSCH